MTKDMNGCTPSKISKVSQLLGRPQNWNWKFQDDSMASRVFIEMFKIGYTHSGRAQPKDGMRVHSSKLNGATALCFARLTPALCLQNDREDL